MYYYCYKSLGFNTNIILFFLLPFFFCPDGPALREHQLRGRQRETRVHQPQTSKKIWMRKGLQEKKRDEGGLEKKKMNDNKVEIGEQARREKNFY